MTPLLFNGHWYASARAIDALWKMLVVGVPHKTPDGRVVLVFDAGGLSSSVNGERTIIASCLVPQNEEGHDLLTVKGDRLHRIELDPSLLPDLERLTKFDHLPEGRKSGALSDGLHKPGDKLA